MKYLKLITVSILLSIVTFSCSSDDSDSNDLPTEDELTNIKFSNPLLAGVYQGIDECVGGTTCFGMPINYDEITFKDDGTFINDRTELATGGAIKNTYSFTGTNEFIISEKENDGSIYVTYQRITEITITELIFEEYKDSDIGEYEADQVRTYTMRRIR